MAALRRQVKHAQIRAAGFARILAGVDPRDIHDRMALAQLPVTRKSDLKELQRAAPPFGGLVVTAPGSLSRIYMSPGSIYDLEGRHDDYWRTARPLFATGFRRGDIIQNCFSYHFTPAAAMVESGAHKLGCAVIPASIGQTEMQVQAMVELQPAGYVGNIAYESEAMEGMILDEDIILELVYPGTGDLVKEGEVGEVVVTTFNPDYPLIRFGTGDLSTILPGISPCGRTNTRIRGWMGRADQTTKVKDMFVHPSQFAEVMKRHAEIVKARLVVDNETGQDRMILECEVVTGSHEGLADALVSTLRDVTKLRGEARLVAPGSLANDGKVIDDVRIYQ